MLASLGAAPPADAASVRSASGPEFSRVTYSADPGETNHLTVSDTGSTLILEDTGATISAGDGCSNETPSRVRCDVGPGQAAYTAYLGDGNDDATIDVAPGGRFDLPEGGGESSAVYGEEGNDTLHGSAVEDSFYGGPGDDVATGGGGNDYLVAGTGADRLDGGSGNDTIGDFTPEELAPPPAQDQDVFTGGDGHDRLEYRGRSAPQTFTFDGVPNDGVAGENDNVGTDFEELYTGAGNDTVTLPAGGFTAYTGAGDDLIVGGSGDDTIHGGPGTDLIDGGAGADWIMGGGGNDYLVGGPGFDHIIGDDSFPPNDSGDDFIDSRDGSIRGDPQRPVDWVVCGGGTDRYLPDYAEYVQIAPSDGCEDVTAPPDPLRSLITDAQASAGPTVARVGVRCPLAGGGTCNGRLSLMSVRSPARELARGSVKLAPGARNKVKLRLASAARKALRSKRLLKARAFVTTAAGGTFRLPGRVTLRRR